jgi:xylulokinase
MPTLPKTGPSLFLGIELATDQLRASIVDETLDLVGVENVDFDSELSEYQCVSFVLMPILPFADDWCRTQGGIFTTPGEAYTTPVEMWLKGLGESHVFGGVPFRGTKISWIVFPFSPIWTRDLFLTNTIT